MRLCVSYHSAWVRRIRPDGAAAVGPCFEDRPVPPRPRLREPRMNLRRPALSLLALLGLAACLLAAPARAEDAAGRSANAALRALLDRGRQRYEGGDYEAALAAANELLHLLPDDADAVRLRRDSCRALLASDGPASRKQRRRDDNAAFLRGLEREMTPTKDVIVGPEHPRPSRPAREPLAPGRERDIHSKMRGVVEVKFHETPLREALATLSELGKFAIVMDPEAAAKARPITMARTRMPVGALVRWLARFSECRYTLRDGAVLFTTEQVLLAEPVRRTYVVSDLVHPPRDAAPGREPGAVEPLPADDAPAAPVVDPEAVGQGWADFIRATVAPDTWYEPGLVAQEVPKNTIAFRNGRLVVLHTPEVHREIAELLSNFRHSLHLQVHCLLRFLFISEADLDAINFEINGFTDGADPPNTWGYNSNGAFDDPVPDPDGKWKSIIGRTQNLTERKALTRFPNFGTSGGGLSLGYAHLGDDDLAVFLNAVKKGQKGTILESARITCFNTQRAIIQRLLQINYVRRIGADDDAEIGNIPEGIIFDVQPFVSADRRYITFTIQPRLRKLIEFASFDFASDPEEFIIGPGGEPAIVGRRVVLPTTLLHSVATTVTIPNGGSILVGGLTTIEDNHALAGIPFVEHLPLIGRIFRGYERAGGRRTLFILLSGETVKDIFDEG